MKMVRSLILAGVIFAGSILPAQAKEKLVILLDWFANPDHATLVVAKERGFL